MSCSKCLAAFTVICVMLCCAAARADDFPGKGNRSDWARAERVYAEGSKLENQSRFSESIPKFQEAISIYPYDGTYHHHLGHAYGKIGDVKNAETSLRQATTLRRRDAWKTWAQLFDLYYQQNRLTEAVQAERNALADCPSDRRYILEQNIKAVEAKLRHQGYQPTLLPQA